jgi:hypothetical protein
MASPLHVFLEDQLQLRTVRDRDDQWQINIEFKHLSLLK